MAVVSQLLLLASLKLGGCKRITDVGLAHVGQLHALRHLNLNYCNQITDTGTLPMMHACW